MKILLVDDDESNLRLMQVLLDGAGHQTVTARNGQDALLLARNEPPDLTITDILMPLLDGYALCRAWQKDSDLRAVPLVFYTATYLSEEDEAFGLSLGAAAFLRKPMEPEALLQEVARFPRPAGGGLDLRPPAEPMDERTFLKLYNQRLVQKVTQRTQKLALHLTELHKVEGILRLKSAALDAAANGIVITDRLGQIEWANPAFLAITGYAWPELQGTTMRLLKSGTHQPGFYQRIWDTILAGRVWQGEIINRHKDGTLHVTQTSITPVLDDHGTITHFIDIMEDITEQKRIEADLRQSQKMDAVGRLAGGVAHDFNNMLNVILMNTELSLMGQELPEGLRKHLIEIEQAAQRSAELTRQLLAFSRKQVAQPRRVALDAAVEESRKMLKRLIAEDVDLRYTPAQDLWAVFMDPSQLSQVLANLVINARDALQGAGTITIETANVRVSDDSVLYHGGMSAGDYVQLTISDTGCGMSAATMEHMFEPFFSTKGEGKGTGLGLSMVYGIVKQNHGAISVYSHLGIGTSMKVYLPRCEEPSEPVLEPAKESAPRGNETVLVAEDEQPVLNVVITALQAQGYTVIASSNPLDAFLLAEHHEGPLHLLLTDVVMPGMNGKELYERLRATRPNLKVLFMSGYSGEVISHRGLLNEGVHFLQKPFTFLDLARRVRETLET